jgi:hypothetical protein
MILRFNPAGGGDGLSVTDPAANVDAPTSVDPTSTAQPMIGLRLLNDDFQVARIAPAAEPNAADPSMHSPPSPSLRVRRIIAHKAHTQPPTHHLRVFEPTDTQRSRRSRVPVTPS